MGRTAEQDAVVGSDKACFAVRASAGSGKTSVLVDRYIRNVVEMGYSPDEIVTVTFTRKAAAEMKSRIVLRLRELHKYDDAQLAETGPIQTLHSFCERLLRENAIEALVDPAFKVLEGPKATSLTESAVRTALLAAKDENEYASALVDKLSGKGTFFAPASAHGHLRQSVTDCMGKLRGTGHDRSSIASLYANPELALDYWAHSLAQEFPEEVSQTIRAGGDWGQAVAAQLKELGAKAPSWIKSQSGSVDLECARDTVGLVWLALTAWDSLEFEMTRLQEFDFALLEHKAVNLLTESAVARDRVQNTVKALLIDEAQDLNPAQYKLIGSINAKSEMLVGDPQQSIYGFRFADRELFIERCNSVDTYYLSRNHRSRDGILHFVDAVFAPQWGSEHSSMVASVFDPNDPFKEKPDPHFEGVELWPVPPRDLDSVALGIKQLIDEGTSAESITVLTRTSKYINQLSPKLTQVGVPNRSVGASERFYTRLEVRDLANALEALTDPREDFSLLALLRSPFVNLSLDAVVWLAANSPVVDALDKPNPFGAEDSLALTALKCWFEKGRRIVDRVPAWETISFLFSETPYLEQLAKRPSSEQALANVRKLLALAADEPELNARDFAQRVREIQFLRHNEGEAAVLDEGVAAVTLMNIHKSKGLEFHTVILPETYVKLDPRKLDVAYNATNGLVVSAFEKRTSSYYSWLLEKEAAKVRQEELRVLYVAMTRAKERLCAVVSETGGHSNPAEILALRSGYPKSVPPSLMVRQLRSGPE